MSDRIVVSELSRQQLSELSNLLSPKMTEYIPYKPTPKQTAFLLLDNREAFYGGAAGGGKGGSLDSLVLTPFGYKKMGSLKVGSMVCNPDGSISNVIAIHPLGQKQLYKFTFSDNTSCEVTDEHLWLAWKNRGSSKAKGQRRSGENGARIWTTTELYTKVNKGRKFNIPITQPVIFTDSARYERRPVNPYFLGVLLGDGCLKNTVTISLADKEIVDIIKDSCKEEINDVRYNEKTKLYLWSLKSTSKMMVYIKKQKLYNTVAATKFIPKAYLLGSIEERWELLRGLMDTDGWVDKDGDIYFSSISKQLIDDTVFLARSLGAYVTERNKVSRYTNKDGTKVAGQKAYTIRLKFRDSSLAFNLSRKKVLAGREPQSMHKQIVSIEKTTIDECQCITVSNPNGLYITNDFIVTHNSIALLMAALQYVDVPHYNAIIFRKTFSELELPEALMDVASQWLTPYKLKKEVRWSDRKKTWTFPSGAKLTFGYLDTPRDKHRYQSAAFHFIGFDEATAFTEEDYLYMFSRCRKTKYQIEVPLRVRAASNPGNIGHKWVKKRFFVEGLKKHRVFIPAVIDDNPYLDKDSYVENLMELDPVTRAQLMEGNWEVEHGGLVFQKEWFPIIDDLPPGFKRRIRYWDLAATQAKEYAKTGYQPSFTCGCLISKMESDFFIEDMQKIQATSLKVEELIRRTAELDGYKTEIWFEEEPGSHSKGYIEHLRDLLREFTVRSKKETEPKLVRAQRTASDVERGRVKLLKGHWNADFLEDALLFGNAGSEKGQIDAFSGGYDKLKHYVSYSVFPTSVNSGSNSYWSGV